MIDLIGPAQSSEEICFYSDASGSKILGYGCIYKDQWIYGQWEAEFMELNKPSIEYLEMFALVAGVFTWEKQLGNRRIVVFCDNEAVVQMINTMTSGCKNCMILLRLLTLNNLQFNRRVAAKYINTKKNFLADSLSRNQLTRFRKLGPHMKKYPDTIHPQLWPMSKLWVY